MTKRELQKQANHVLGPGAIVEIVREGRLNWVVRAYTINFGIVAGGIARDSAVARANSMLVHLDTSGWSWRLS